MYNEGNVPTEVNLPGGVKGALWTIAGGAIANAAKTLGVNPGNIFGNGCGCGGCAPQAVANAVLAEKDAEIAKLRAEKYSDNAAQEQANRLLQNYLKPYGDAIALGQSENARLNQQLKDLEEIRRLEKELMHKDLELVRQESKCCCEKNAMMINCLQNTVAQIAVTRVPNSILTPGVPTVNIVHPTTTTAA
jgi:hypothetical protein